MTASYRPKSDRVIDKIRDVFLASGYDESVTASLVPKVWSDAFSPWSDAPPLISSQPMLGVLEEYSKNIGSVNLLRRSLVPSLIEVARINEYRSNVDVNLFETAKVYLSKGENEIPDQPTKIGIVSRRDFFSVKGVIEALVSRVNPARQLTVEPCKFEILDASQSGELKFDGELLGWIGQVSKSARKKFGLRSDAIVAELDLAVLEKQAIMIPQHENQSTFPPVSRDFNFVVDNAVRWGDLEATVRTAGGELLESIDYRETFRDEKKDGAGKKRLLMSVVLRSATATLSGEEADKVCKSIISSCESKHSAALLG